MILWECCLGCHIHSGCWAFLGLSWGNRTGSGRQGPSHHPSQKQAAGRYSYGHLQPKASGTSLGLGQEWAEMLPFRWAQLGRAHDQVGQGCKEIETSPTVALLEQELEVLWG